MRQVNNKINGKVSYLSEFGAHMVTPELGTCAHFSRRCAKLMRQALIMGTGRRALCWVSG